MSDNPVTFNAKGSGELRELTLRHRCLLPIYLRWKLKSYGFVSECFLTSIMPTMSLSEIVFIGNRRQKVIDWLNQEKLDLL